MKGIYITLEKKLELEAEIAQREKALQYESIGGSIHLEATIGAYKRILSEAIVLPVEESWSDTSIWQHEGIREHFEAEYPIGVIIKPKEL
jgi:hypothetical protein